MAQLFRDIPGDPSERGLARWSPACDVIERDNALVVRADLPGMEEKDIAVEVQDHRLTIRGERKKEEETTKDGVHRIERHFGSFYRSFPLPTNVKEDAIKATCKGGVLEVTLPKADGAKARKIDVQPA